MYRAGSVEYDFLAGPPSDAFFLAGAGAGVEAEAEASAAAAGAAAASVVGAGAAAGAGASASWAAGVSDLAGASVMFVFYICRSSSYLGRPNIRSKSSSMSVCFVFFRKGERENEARLSYGLIDRLEPKCLLLRRSLV